MIGRYEILGELGRGAMGSVLRARDPIMGRVVAIKSIHAASLAGDQAAEFRERFYREARAAGALSHPGIVPVFDVGEDNGSPYLVMELVQGRTLDMALKQGERYSIERVCEIGQQIAEALGFAHRNGVVHRDIKPANILMTTREVYGVERPRITDFGVAKLAGGEMTSTGQLLGTPAFMPPEQFTGAPIDNRTDLFSVGVILYRMTTGEQPFAGETLTAVSYKVVHTEPIPPSKLNPAVSKQLEAVILKCLAKSPADRYQTGEELAADLATLRKSTNGAHPPPTYSSIMDSGVGETIDQVSSLRPSTARTYSSATAGATMQSAPAVATQSLSTGIHAWPVTESQTATAMQSMPSARQTLVPNASPDAFVSQPQAAQPVAVSGKRSKPRLLVIAEIILAVAAVAGIFLIHKLKTEATQQAVSTPAPPVPQPVAPAAQQAASTPAQPATQPVAPAAQRAATAPMPSPSASPKQPATLGPARPATAPVEPSSTPEKPEAVMAKAPPSAPTPTVSFNPKSLDPAANTHLKLNLDGFSAPLILTLQMDGKLYWTGTAGDKKSYQELLVPPGKHEFQVVVKGQDAAKTSNAVNGDFAAKKRMTLSVKLRPQATGGSPILDPATQVSAGLKRDIFPF
jgi:serine/threonine-protein kinase